MWEATEKVELGFNPAEDLFWWDEEFDVAEAPQIPESRPTEMSEETGIWDQEAYDEDED